MTRTERAIRDVFPKNAEINILRSCNPNRLGIIALVHSVTENMFYVVQEFQFDECDSDWDSFDYSTREQAESIYNGFMKDRSNTPNWEMQAEYDEMHGTINGEDAGIVAMRELWGE